MNTSSNRLGLSINIFSCIDSAVAPSDLACFEFASDGIWLEVQDPIFFELGSEHHVALPSASLGYAVVLGAV